MEIDYLIKDFMNIKIDDKDENKENKEIIIYRKNMNIYNSLEKIINLLNEKNNLNKIEYLGNIKEYIKKLYMLDNKDKEDLIQKIDYSIEDRKRTIEDNNKEIIKKRARIE